jgi:hypothetical protein
MKKSLFLNKIITYTSFESFVTDFQKNLKTASFEKLFFGPVWIGLFCELMQINKLLCIIDKLVKVVYEKKKNR